MQENSNPPPAGNTPWPPSPLIILLLALLCPSWSGCVTALQVNAPSKQKVRLQAKAPERYTIHVASSQPADYPVASDGRVRFDVPNLGTGCSSKLFGVIPVYDESPGATKAIHLLRDATVVRKFSLNQIDRLPLDDEGFRVIRVSD